MMHHSGRLRGATRIRVIFGWTATKSRALRCALALLAVHVGGAVLFMSSAALAHPAGSSSVNRYLGFEYAGAGVLRIAYLLDFAEIPAYAEIDALDADHDGSVTPEEQRRYLDVRLGELVRALRVELNGVRVTPTIVSSHLETAPGEGGMSTLRIAAELAATCSPRCTGADVEVYARDDSFADHPGWRQISAGEEPGPAVNAATPPRATEARFTLHAASTVTGPTLAPSIPPAGLLRWVEIVGGFVVGLGALLSALAVRRALRT
jgi:hypothetical protein